MYESMHIEGDAAMVQFSHAEDGMVLGDSPDDKGPAAPSELTGFAIAGADKKFVTAQAQLSGDAVKVWSDAVNQPVAVRYAWADNPAVDVYDAAGLPARAVSHRRLAELSGGYPRIISTP